MSVCGNTYVILNIYMACMWERVLDMLLNVV